MDKNSIERCNLQHCFDLVKRNFGIPTFAVMMALCIFEMFQNREMTKKNLILLVSGAGASTAVLLTLLTAGHPLSLLLYNFRDVAGDQYWYFGNDGRIWKIIEPRDLKIIAWDILMFLFVSVIALLAFNSRYMRLVSLGWATFLGGALAVIAGHYSTGYMDAFELWMDWSYCRFSSKVCRACARNSELGFRPSVQSQPTSSRCYCSWL